MSICTDDIDMYEEKGMQAMANNLPFIHWLAWICRPCSLHYGMLRTVWFPNETYEDKANQNNIFDATHKDRRAVHGNAMNCFSILIYIMWVSFIFSKEYRNVAVTSTLPPPLPPRHHHPARRVAWWSSVTNLHWLHLNCFVICWK